MELDERWTWMSALVWLCSANGDTNAAYLISVGGKYMVVLVSMVLVSISLVVA